MSKCPMLNKNGTVCKNKCMQVGDNYLRFCTKHFDTHIFFENQEWKNIKEESKIFYYLIVENTFGSIERFTDTNLQDLSFVFNSIFGDCNVNYSLYKCKINNYPEFISNSLYDLKGNYKSYKGNPYKKTFVCERCNVLVDETFESYDCDYCEEPFTKLQG